MILVKVFITGGTGFIGKEITKILNKENQHECFILTRKSREDNGNVHYVTGDIRNGEDIDNIMAEIRPDVLVHLAWNVEEDNYADSLENDKWVSYTIDIVESFFRHGGHKVVGAGTCFEYDLTGNKPRREDDKCFPATRYGRAKLECYELLKKLCKEYKADFIWGRIFYPYGKGELSRKFISWAREKIMLQQKFYCNTPENCIDYIHVSDVAYYFVKFICDDRISGIVNVCSGKGIKIRSILELLMEKCGKKCEVEYKEQKSPLVIVGDTERIEKYKLKCLVDIESGIEAYN